MTSKRTSSEKEGSSTFYLMQTCLGSKARAGELVTPHGVVHTPVFLPVASQGTVKTHLNTSDRVDGSGGLGITSLRNASYP